MIREVNSLSVNPGCAVACVESTSGKKLMDPKTIVLYPNPVDNMIYIAGLQSSANLEVYSSTGLSLLKGTGTSINVSSLSPGTYFIRVRSGDTSQTYTFIKQ